MKKFFLFIIIAYLLPFTSFSQINEGGLPFYEKYTDKDYGDAGQVWAITQDTRGVMYFGCNFGLKTYDGINWKSYNIPNSTIIRSLAAGDNGEIFYGAEGDFGMMKPNKTGEMEFYSFFLNYFPENAQPEFSSVWKTLIADNNVYFQAFEKVFYTSLPIKIDESGKLLNKINHVEPEKSPFHLSFSVNNKFYVREWEKGLCEINDNRTKLIPGGEQFAYMRIYAMLPIDNSKILIASKANGFFIYDTGKTKNSITPFVTENDELFKNGLIYSGTMLANGNIAVGTLSDGIIIFDKQGKIINHYNSEVGLPKKIIISTFSNTKIDNAPLWFFYDDSGLYKADVLGPFKEWGEYKGIKPGAVNNIIKFKGRLYVTANNGIYFLEKDEYGKQKFKFFGEIVQAWAHTIYTVPNSKEEKLLVGGYDGVFEIIDTTITLVAQIQNAQSLFQSKKTPNKLFVGSAGGLVLLEYKNNNWANLGTHKSVNYQVGSIFEDKDFLALGSNKGVIILDDFNDTTVVTIDSTRNLHMFGQDYFIHKYKDELIIASGSGLYIINKEDTTAIPLQDFGTNYNDSSTGVYSFVEEEDAFWLSVFGTNTDDANFNLVRYFKGKELTQDSVFAKRIPQKTTYAIFPDGKYVWVGNDKGLYKFDKSKQKNYSVSYNTLISKVTTTRDSLLFSGTNSVTTDNVTSIQAEQNENNVLELSYKYNEINFEWAASFFELEEKTVYSHRLLGQSERWSKWGKKNDTRYTNLYEGDYTFEVKAKNIYNTESNVARYSFTIFSPWYRTIWAYIMFFILGVFLIFIIIKLYTKKLKRENEKLEQTVKERTAEIRMQNEEITAQRDEIQEQKDQVEKSKDKIEKQQKHIMDSIHYASRIQEAVLPPDDFLQEILGDHFVLFKPRDIVSGDFYWATQRGNKTVIVAADCTGHGVPGAFMSMLGISFLNEIVNKEEVLEANHILNRLRENVKRSLRQTGKDNEAKDGMDLALCIIDSDNMKLQFAGAYNPLYLLRDGEIQRIKPDRMPIGIYLREKESFTNNIVDIQKGDLLYIFSDGYVDQFGGNNDKKIRSVKFKEILLENHKKSLEEQKGALVSHLDFWMNHTDKKGRKYKQVDDILVIGIEI